MVKHQLGDLPVLWYLEASSVQLDPQLGGRHKTVFVPLPNEILVEPDPRHHVYFEWDCDIAGWKDELFPGGRVMRDALVELPLYVFDQRCLVRSLRL